MDINNFHGHLPGGFYRLWVEWGREKNASRLYRGFAERYDQSPFGVEDEARSRSIGTSFDQERWDREKSLCSEIFLGQTRRQFHQTIDRILTEDQFDLENVQEIVSAPASPEVLKIARHVYARMRDIGYTHYELIS